MAEKRLIDANKLNVCYINTGTVMFPKMEAFVRADDIADAPTVDAVEVVRCRECRHWNSETGFCNLNSHFSMDELDWDVFNDDDFCSLGERRTDG